MGRCKNDALISKIGAKKLQKEVETEFTVFNYLPDCRRIPTSKKMSSAATAPYFKFDVPENQFECMREGCVNTGTLVVGALTGTFKAPWDATEFANGVVTFYTSGYNGEITFKISSDSTLTNADSYTVDLSKIQTGEDGYKAVVIDLSKEGTQVGSGWTPKHEGAFISIKANGSSEEVGEFGISSISIFDELEDFETSATVRIACLSQLGGAFEFEAAEQTCFGNGGIDDEALDGLEKTLTGKALTPNFQALNPLWGKGEATEGWDTVTIEATVEHGTGDDEGYGVITLPGKLAKECGFISVARADNCNVTDAHLTELRVPGLVDIDEGHFIVIDQSKARTDVIADDLAKIYVNEALAGKTLIVAYPQVVDVEEYVFDVDNIRNKRIRWSYTRTYTDGVKWRFVYDNVIITSFPDELTEDEAEFEFTVTIQKDATGRYGRAYRILD